MRCLGFRVSGFRVRVRVLSKFRFNRRFRIRSRDASSILIVSRLQGSFKGESFEAHKPHGGTGFRVLSKFWVWGSLQRFRVESFFKGFSGVHGPFKGFRA